MKLSKLKTVALGIVVFFGLTALPSNAGDTRELVKLPEMMKQHMLRNMRDHLAALDEIFRQLAQGKYEKAGEIAENRLGMSSMGHHGANHMAPFMPGPMKALGTQMHRAASQFVLAAQQAELEEGGKAVQKVFGALHEVTAACNGCHQAYRVH